MKKLRYFILIFVEWGLDEELSFFEDLMYGVLYLTQSFKHVFVMDELKPRNPCGHFRLSPVSSMLSGEPQFFSLVLDWKSLLVSFER